MAAESETNPIFQLEQAVAAVPPDVEAAHGAITAIEDALPSVPGEAANVVLTSAIDLTGKMADAILATKRFKDKAAVAARFTDKQRQFRVIANVLGIDPIAQAEPTQTAGKNQTGGKR